MKFKHNKIIRRVVPTALCMAMVIPCASIPTFAVQVNPEITTLSSTSSPNYIENHDYVDCVHYYSQNGQLYYQIKYPKNCMDSVILKVVDSQGCLLKTQANLQGVQNWYGFQLNYLYSDDNFEYQELVISFPSNSYQNTWAGAGLKIYANNGTDSYRATNTSYYNTAEGNGYYLTR